MGAVSGLSEGALPPAKAPRVRWKMLLQHLFVLVIVSANVSAVLRQMPTQQEERPPVLVAVLVLTVAGIVAYLWARFLVWLWKRLCRWVHQN
jgi:hypothetical protein